MQIVMGMEVLSAVCANRVAGRGFGKQNFTCYLWFLHKSMQAPVEGCFPNVWEEGR